ncbi:MAG: hypothetical protein FWC38_00675 [Proteobacteria bacterium]|nr:hypothetical protein [Pseudomonadota bacterium]MCL2306756.1 hypothetical protein [Pseudomonadota bacterium]
MVSRTYKWRERWQVDLMACTATHDTRLVVYFGNVPDGAQPFGAGFVMPANLANVQAALEAKNGLHNTPIMIRRLANEAVKIWQRERDHAVNR